MRSGTVKVVVAPDSFKDCLPAGEVCRIIADRIALHHPDWTVAACPLSDGGEGFARILTDHLGGELVPVDVTGPLGESVTAFYGRYGDTAIMDVASACGLQLVPPSRRNPLRTTSRGVGEMILCASKDGCRKLIIGLGGSSTCDGGEGMMSVRGLRELSGTIEIEAYCDVVNPFLGLDGAARVFGPQKGADPAMVEALESRMQERAEVILRETGKDISATPGAGAAGGLAGALTAYFGARILSGVDSFLDCIGYDALVEDANLVITGEGRSDAQTLMGKVPYGVLNRTPAGIPVVLLSGAVENRDALLDAGFADAIGATPSSEPLYEALRPGNAARNISAAVDSFLCCAYPESLLTGAHR
jgi:glycerate kinase